MKLQNNLIRAFLLLIMLIGSTMFCMAQNIGNMAKFSFNGDFQNEDKSNAGLFSLNKAETRERTWQIGEIPFRKLAFEYDDYYFLVLNISLNCGFDFGGIGVGGLGCDFEFRFFGFFGLQTGLSYFLNMDYSFSEQEPTHYVVQIPLLGELNLPLEFFQVSVFAGIGINLLTFSNHNISITSFSTMSYILGSRLNFAVGKYLNIFASYQYNCDFSDTEYHYKGLKTNSTYTAERSFLYIGIGWYIPL